MKPLYYSAEILVAFSDATRSHRQAAAPRDRDLRLTRHVPGASDEVSIPP